MRDCTTAETQVARRNRMRWSIVLLGIGSVWGCTESSGQSGFQPTGGAATTGVGASPSSPGGGGRGNSAGGIIDSLGSGGEPGEGGGSSIPPLELGPLLPTSDWPKTIPSVRQWRAYGDPDARFTPSGQSLIWVSPGNAALAEAGQTLADDLKVLLGARPEVVEGNDPGPSDIVLALTKGELSIGEEGYVLAISDRVTIQARTVSGAFWGTRTLLQLLSQQLSLTPGAARDWPAYPERGFMIDNGRSYFTPAWLRAQIRQLAYLKMNIFHWHLSDKEGFRVESKEHPEIVSAEHLSQAEVADLVSLAKRYHVEIIPEIDVPGHMDAILSAHPELVAEQDTYPSAQIDYTREEGRALVHEILEEMLTVFSGRYFHIGADEFTPFFEAAWEFAQVKYGGNPEVGGMDVAIAYVNDLAAQVRSHGKVPRAWSDVLVPNGVVEELDRGIILENWIDRGESPAALVNAGFSLMNANWECTYSKDEITLLSNDCAPFQFTDGTTLSADAPQLLGTKYHVWCDPAEYFCPNEQTVAERVYLPLRALAQNAWGSQRLFADVDDFRALVEMVGAAPQPLP